MYKFEIAAELARCVGYTSYLEIGTPTTGKMYNCVHERFTQKKRLLYRCSRKFRDGEKVDFRSPSDSIDKYSRKLLRSKKRFDLVFVDPWHTYECSRRDIELALRLLNPGGAVLIHDCNPPHALCTSPEPLPGEWCGMTFGAYLDVVHSQNLFHFTVDTDYGCGILTTHPGLANMFPSTRDPQLKADWEKSGFLSKYSFLDKNRVQLLNLISVKDFTQALAGYNPLPSPTITQAKGREKFSFFKLINLLKVSINLSTMASVKSGDRPM